MQLKYFHFPLREEGITLLEILFVTVIIGLISIATIAFMQNYSQSTLIKHTQNKMQRISDLGVLYYLYHSKWPANFQNLVDAGLAAPLEQCSPWVSSSSTIPACANAHHRGYELETSGHTNQFIVSLTLEDPLMLEKIAVKLPNAAIKNHTLSLHTPTPQQVAISNNTGLIRLIGYTDYRGAGGGLFVSGNREGNGVSVPLDYPSSCPADTVPVIFHAAYKFTCPINKETNPFDWWDGPCYLAMKYVDQLAYPIGSSPSINNPPTKAKLCIRTKLDETGQIFMAHDGYRHSRLRFFTVCLDKNKVVKSNAPPYNTYHQDGKNNLGSTGWCTSGRLG